MQQQTNQSMKMTQISPIEQLLANNAQLQERCRQQEVKLNEDFAFIQSNASTLFMSGLSTLLFSKKDSGNKNNVITKNDGHGQAKTSPLSVSDYLSITKSLFPAIWEIAQPILLTWGINKTKNWFYGLFSRKKKHTAKI